ncbi:MAG TPA: DUF1552 domain-containing protein [Polyangiaceae bacterium]|nr:DUF1552 domain-containing protein [Polyangiaceae bacterium]
MPSKSRIGLSRRALLHSLGLGAAASTLLPLLNASGQEAVLPKRLLLIFSPDGMAAQDYNNTVDWRPTGTETDFTLHAIHTPLEPFKAKMVVPWGLTLTAGGAGEAHAYGMAGLWTGATLHDPSGTADFDGGNGHRTGWGSAASVDQLVAQAFGPKMPYQRGPTDAAQETKYRSVALGVQCGGPTSLNRMTYTGDNQPIHPEVSPKAAFDRLFAGVTPGGGMTPTEDPAVTQARNEQKALVDVLKKDLGRIRTRVGKEEYLKIDKHLEGLLSIERRLNDSMPTMVSSGCTLPTAPPATSGSNGGGNANYPNQVTQMMDIVSHALACDVTRVATLQLSYGFSNVTHTWLGHTSAHHTMSHDGMDRRTELQAIDNWYAKQVAYLLQQLDAVKEGGGTLLDNTLVVWGRELGSTAHRMDRSPLLMFGKAGGALKTQRNLNFDKQQHVKLLVSIAQLMGLTTTSLGDRQPNSGPLAGLV